MARLSSMARVVIDRAKQVTKAAWTLDPGVAVYIQTTIMAASKKCPPVPGK